VNTRHNGLCLTISGTLNAIARSHTPPWQQAHSPPKHSRTEPCMKPRVAALIPCYNESSHIADVVRRAQPHVDAVVVVDDGSSDATAANAEKAGAIVLRHPSNQGKGISIRTGMTYAFENGFDLLMFLDGDGQHDPKEIHRFLDAQRESGAAVVVGNRMQNVSKMPWLRKWTNRFTSWILSRMAGQPIPDSQCGFRLLHKSVVPDFQIETSRFDTESEMLIQASRRGHKIASVPIETIYEGQEKESKIHPCRDTIRFFTLIWRNRKSREMVRK
jgi:glycosyltransferase involved in cell wall biosynthesis